MAEPISPEIDVSEKNTIKDQHSLLSEIRKTQKLPHLDKYSVYGSAIEEYEDYFSPIFEGKLSDFLRERERPVVLDLMAPSDTIASLFKQLPRKHLYGLAVSREDRRTIIKKARDKFLGIEQMAADITMGSTWREINRKLGDRKADLIIERGKAGIMELPLGKQFLGAVLRESWDLLSSNNGMLLAEIPNILDLSTDDRIDIQAWIKLINQSGIEAKYIQPVGPKRNIGHNSLVKIIKAPSSPSKIPFLA